MRKRFAGRPLEHQSQERRICLAYECTKSCEQKLSDIGWKVIHLLALYPIAEATIVVCAKQTQPLMRRYGRQMSLRKSCLKEKSPASGRGLVEDTMEMTGRGLGLKAADLLAGSLRRVMMLRSLTVSRNPSAAEGGRAHTYRSQAAKRARPQWHPYGT